MTIPLLNDELYLCAFFILKNKMSKILFVYIIIQVAPLPCISSNFSMMGLNIN